MAKAIPPTAVSDLIEEWELTLRSRRKAPRTVLNYVSAMRAFDEFLGHPVAAAVTRSDCERFMVAQLERYQPSTAFLIYRQIKTFWRWVEEVAGEVPRSPMVGTEPPSVPERPVPVLEDLDLGRLVKVCAGRDYDARRDSAIIRLLIDTPMRRDELLMLRVDDVFVEANHLRVRKTKSGREISLPFGDNTRLLLKRYIRSRAVHPKSHLDAMWLGRKGALGRTGLAAMLNRRAAQAGIEDVVYPHKFRHTFVNNWLEDETRKEGDLMALTDWKNRDMIDHYARSVRERRAHRAHRKDAPGDRFPV